MNINASARPALILATGILLCLAGPIPSPVASAYAQTAASTLADSAGAMSARANSLLAAADKPAEAAPAAEADVVASDQLNDVDRTLPQQQQSQTAAAAEPAQTVAMAPVKAAAMVAASGESSTWDQTSMIGKIFIAFGALLTMASAARMFMA